MSIVTVLATTKFISVMTDGRITGDDGIINCEEYQKVLILKENTFIAFTGRVESFELLLSQINLDEYNNYKDFSLHIYEIFLRMITNNQKLVIVIGGINSKNEIGYCYFSNIGHALTEVKPSKDNEIDRLLLVNSGFGIEALLDNCLMKTGFDTLEKVIEIQGCIHDYQAKHDVAVNYKKYHVVIKR